MRSPSLLRSLNRQLNLRLLLSSQQERGEISQLQNCSATTMIRSYVQCRKPLFLRMMEQLRTKRK